MNWFAWYLFSWYKCTFVPCSYNINTYEFNLLDVAAQLELLLFMSRNPLTPLIEHDIFMAIDFDIILSEMGPLIK